ncbi:MAG TPA: hypothetical protein PLA12_14240 [Candidatus Hydrogenedens sp.]|nr:hypothetical protein [Candidatus Hydrogenedens sp.]
MAHIPKYIKLYVTGYDEQSLYAHGVIVEDINLNSNGINTASFSYYPIYGELSLSVGQIIKIWARGDWYGNSVLINKKLSEIEQSGVLDNPPTVYYYEVIFIGRVKRIEVEKYSGNNYKYRIEAVGIEEDLQEVSFNSYNFFDTENQQVVEVAGMPNFAGLNRKVDENLFVKEGLGVQWSCYDALMYFKNTFVSPYFSGAIYFDNITIQTLQNTPYTSKTQFYNHFEFLNIICGNLFTWTAKYIENLFYLNIRFNYNADTSVSLPILPNISASLESIELPQKIILTYPFLIDYTTAPFQSYIFRHPDNYLNEVAYDLTPEEMDLAKVGEPYVRDIYYVLPPTENPAPLPIPHPVKYDWYLKNSIGSKLGVHSKFVIQPIFEYDSTMFNLDDFEWVKLNNIFLIKNGVPVYFNSNKPYKNFTISINGCDLSIDCDIPHQFAPSTYTYPFSMIEIPVFPIDNNDGIVINGLLKSKNVRRIKYRGIVNGRQYVYRCENLITDEVADSILDNLYFLINGIQRNNLNYKFPLLEYYNEFLGLNNKRINVIWQNIGGSDTSSNINSMIASTHIYREGAGYWCEIQTDFQPNIDSLIPILLFNRTFEIQDRQNSISFEGNEGEFYGKITDIKYNNYVVDCDFQEDLEVARIDDFKLGYWSNTPPSDNYYFEKLLKEDSTTEYEPSRRKSYIVSGGVEEMRENKIVPAEIEFPIIKFKWGIGNIPVMIVDFDPQGYPIYRFVKFIDLNEGGRSWAEIVE